jgi:hypothetical protein
MDRPAYFIRRHGDECSIIKLHPDGREEILEQGLMLVDVETLYFICIGEPVHEHPAPTTDHGAEPPDRCQSRQLAFKF